MGYDHLCVLRSALRRFSDHHCSHYLKFPHSEIRGHPEPELRKFDTLGFLGFPNVL